jgi:DNA-binding NarL/FixJ family response regulator
VAVRVVLAEDSLLVREGTVALLETEPDLEVIAVCEDLPGLLETVDQYTPDVVVTDIRMPPGHSREGIEAAERLRRESPDVGVVVLSQYAEPSYAVALFEGGSSRRAYLLKERLGRPEQLFDAIRAVATGGSVVDPQIVEILVNARTAKQASALERLTSREREVLSQMAEGHNNAAIAKRLSLSAGAVEKHINNIFSKLDLAHEPDVHRRVRAVLLFLNDQPAG